MHVFGHKCEEREQAIYPVNGRHVAILLNLFSEFFFFLSFLLTFVDLYLPLIIRTLILSVSLCCRRAREKDNVPMTVLFLFSLLPAFLPSGRVRGGEGREGQGTPEGGKSREGEGRVRHGGSGRRVAKGNVGGRRVC